MTSRDWRRRWCAAMAVASILTVAACGEKPKPPAPAAVVPIADCVDEAEQRANGVTMTRSDGDKVDGLIYGSGETAVVYANQLSGDLCQWQANAQTQAKQPGYQAAVFNYSMYSGYEYDVLAAVAVVRSRGAKRIFLVGASKGGTGVLAAAAVAAPPVNGVVDLSGPQSLSGTSAAIVMKTFTTPVLFIVGDNDEPYLAETRALYAACGAKDKKLIVRNSGAHGVALVDVEVNTMMQEFFNRH
jgi:hypothetical protein